MASESLLSRRHFFIVSNNRHYNTFLFFNSVLFFLISPMKYMNVWKMSETLPRVILPLMLPLFREHLFLELPTHPFYL